MPDTQPGFKSLARARLLAEFPSNNSGVSEAGPGVAPTHRGPRRTVAGGPSRGSLRGEVGWLLKRRQELMLD